MSSNQFSNGSVLWEVVVPFLRWPLWSPLRFITTVSLIVLVLVGWSQATAEDAPAQEAEVEAPSDATSVASEFMGTWGDPEAERGEWRTAVQGMGTDELDRQWAQADPSDVPVSVTREITPVKVEEDERVIYSITTDGPRVQLVTEKEPTGWKVASIEPEVEK